MSEEDFDIDNPGPEPVGVELFAEELTQNLIESGVLTSMEDVDRVYRQYHEELFRLDRTIMWGGLA